MIMFISFACSSLVFSGIDYPDHKEYFGYDGFQRFPGCEEVDFGEGVVE